MRTYHLYLIDSDIAKAYFGREAKLFDLFSRFACSCSLSEKKILYKQIKFITKPLQMLKLNHRIEQKLKHNPYYIQEQAAHILRIPSSEEFGTLTIKSQYARIDTNKSFEIETTFFEILRREEATLLAMDYKANRYGWLNPIKQERKYV
ncbi:sporulation inhibitor of replication protein SirA [Bacillus sp. 165]|uniref:sporulation inhibitor of replication protein SirA n=1 Tax=Bacillus sp. 165 TaxID=1529117 RepID=UPI001ADA9E25|nr:sporulation inhibitor of replication protein SirA [Bacillus sp. 165]